MEERDLKTHGQTRCDLGVEVKGSVKLKSNIEVKESIEVKERVETKRKFEVTDLKNMVTLDVTSASK